MRYLTRSLVVGAAVAQLGVGHAQTAVDILTAGCADDAQKLCAGVQSGGGRIIACLKQHKDSLSEVPAGCQAGIKPGRRGRTHCPSRAGSTSIPAHWQ